MTAQKDKQPEGGQGRSGDVQARQADDGSFELVVDDGSSTSSDSPDGEGSAPSSTRAMKSHTSGSRRLSVVVVVAIVALGVLVYGLTGDEDSVPVDSDDGVQVKAGFRPYLGGPGDDRAAAAPDSQKSSDEQPSDEFEEDEAIAADDSEPMGDEEGWEEVDDGEVIVIEEEHPPEDIEDIEEVDSPEESVEAPDMPLIDKPRIPNFRERIRLPVQPAEIKYLPNPKLNKIQPRLHQMRERPAAGDEARLDEQDQFEDEGYEEEGYEDEMVDGEVDPEYGEQDDSFDEYDEGY